MSEKKIKLDRLLTSLLIGFITFFFSLVIALGKSGFDVREIFDQFLFYFAIGGVSAFLLFIMFEIEALIKTGDKIYGNTLYFASLGKGVAWKGFRKFTLMQITWLSLIFFSILGTFAVTRNITWAGIASLEQQFSPITELFFSLSLVPGAENFSFVVVLGVAVTIITLLARIYKLDKDNYRIFIWTLVPLLTVFFWVAIHQLRYSGQGISLINVGIFALAMTILTLVTGSAIPAWIMHILNNFFYQAKNLFSSDIVITYTIVFLIFSVLAYGYFYRGRWFGQKTKAKR